jgi:CheY-like chemotaxis protein
MDISMPIMDGYLATQKIRDIERNDSTKSSYICGLTGHNTEAYKKKSFEVGMDNYCNS